MTVTTLKRLDPTQVELEIPIPHEELEKAEEASFRSLVRGVKIPGFRPGKAPRRIFEAQYGHGMIHERALEALIPRAYAEAIREHGLDPLSRPEMEFVGEPETEGDAEPDTHAPLRLKATVTIRPEIELKNYRGIAIEQDPIVISDADVEQALEGLQREAAVLVPVDRPVALGDVATLDYEGKIDGVAFEGGTATNQPTEIVAERFIEGFADGIVGMKAGETKDVAAKFPEGYTNADLSGKDAIFTITVHDVKTPELPPLDDDFAKRYNPEATLETLRKDLRERLVATANDRTRRASIAKVLDKLRAEHEVPLPEVWVEREAAGLLEEGQTQASRMGIEWPAYLERAGRTEESLKEEYRVEAEMRVKTTLLLEAIAKAEKIEATPADIDNEIAVLANQYGQPPDAIRRMLGDSLGSIVDGVVRSKTVEFLLREAKITDTATKSEEA